MDRDTAREKIKKCLALSKSSNEHEAAATLRQAQRLMEMHGISIDEVDENAVTSDFVDHDDYEFSKRKPMVIMSVVHLMRRAFGVMPIWERSPKQKHRIRYFGQQANVMLAVHAHTVVYRAAMRSWDTYLRENPHFVGRRNARASFVDGWRDSVGEKVAKISPDAEAAKRMEKKILEHYGGISNDGAERGKSFSIHRPVDTTNRYLENK